MNISTKCLKDQKIVHECHQQPEKEMIKLKR